MGMMAPGDQERLAAQVLELCRSRNLTIGTVESCTGGMVAGALTAVAGSSDVVMSGLVTYSNDAKVSLAQVPPALIAEFGAVSEQVARAMCSGGRDRLAVDVCVSVTGIAGPGGGSAQKPVGLVWFGIATAHAVHAERRLMGDLGRQGIRERSVIVALGLIGQAVSAKIP